MFKISCSIKEHGFDYSNQWQAMLADFTVGERDSLKAGAVSAGLQDRMKVKLEAFSDSVKKVFDDAAVAAEEVAVKSKPDDFDCLRGLLSDDQIEFLQRMKREGKFFFNAQTNCKSIDFVQILIQLVLKPKRNKNKRR
jgi:hypothetical protein